MSFLINYKKLFQINLYHQYFLNDGVTAFDANASLKTQQLSKYDFSSFAEIVPSEATNKKLNGTKIILKKSSAGVSAYISAEETAPNSNIFKPYISLQQNDNLLFLLYIKDPFFENYSTVAANPTIPYLFSNKKPSTEGSGLRYIDLESTTHAVEDFSIAQTTFEAFYSAISEKERIGLFAVIHLEMAGDDTTGVDGNARNVINTDGTLQSTAPTFKIQIANRSTIWNYINPTDNSLLHSSDPTELPLVKNGIVGYTFDSKERPSAQPFRLVFEKDGGGNIIKTISEIFIN